MTESISLEDLAMVLNDPELRSEFKSELQKEIDREIIRKICEEAGVTPPDA